MLVFEEAEMNLTPALTLKSWGDGDHSGIDLQTVPRSCLGVSAVSCGHPERELTVQVPKIRQRMKHLCVLFLMYSFLKASSSL